MNYPASGASVEQSGSGKEITFLYKYRALNEQNHRYMERIFTHNELYFPSPREFNDPFDSKIQLYFDGTEEEWSRYLTGLYKKFQPELNRIQRHAEVKKVLKEKRYKRIPDSLSDSYIDEMGVFCMSERRDHILMWSHYAEKHTGFCLEFLATLTTPFFGRAQKVKYRARYPAVNFFKSSRDEQMEATLLTKASFWEYEQEWRIIGHNHGPGTYQFPPQLLTGVILDCQMQDETKQTIKEWASRRNPCPRVYQAEVKQREFGIAVVEIEKE